MFMHRYSDHSVTIRCCIRVKRQTCSFHFTCRSHQFPNMQQISEVLVNGVRKRHSSLIDRSLKISSHQRVLPWATTIRLRMVVLILSICVHVYTCVMYEIYTCDTYEIYTCDMSCMRFTVQENQTIPILSEL